MNTPTPTTIGATQIKSIRVIKFYCLLLIILYFKIGLFNYVCYDQSGKLSVCASDYTQYYSASLLAREHTPAYAYDPARLKQVGEEITGQKVTRLAWNYPPTFLLLVFPLSVFPHDVSFFLWLAVTFAGYLLVIYRIAPHKITFWLATVFPAAIMNFHHGQNGFLFASLLGGGLLLLSQSPVVAGILFGLFTCKPQFAFLLPIALIAGGQWKAFVSMTVTTIMMIIISIAVFGWQTWIAFFENMPFTKKLLETGSAPWPKMPTFFVSARMVGFSTDGAYLLQALIAMTIIGIVYYVWSQRKATEVTKSILVLGILLMTPYALVHDLTMLAIPIAYLGWKGYRTGWLPYEKFAITAVWHIPLISLVIAALAPVQIGPLVIAAYLILVLRRTPGISYMCSRDGCISNRKP